jgi:hypothetical protein
VAASLCRAHDEKLRQSTTDFQTILDDTNMTEQQLMTYALAALTIIAIWLGLKVAKKMLKIAFFLIALLAVAFLLLKAL